MDEYHLTHDHVTTLRYVQQHKGATILNLVDALQWSIRKSANLLYALYFHSLLTCTIDNHETTFYLTSYGESKLEERNPTHD